MTEPYPFDHDAITSSRPADVRDEPGHNDPAQDAAVAAAGRLRDRGPDDAPDAGEDGSS